MDRWHDQAWSRAVAWLKIVLPLTALGLLSTLFLLSRSVDPMSTLPLSEGDIEERARGQQMTDLSYSGTTEEGHLIAFSADAARPDKAITDRINTERPKAVIDLTDGGRLTMHALKGQVNEPDDLARLTGGVEFTSTTGYRLKSEDISSALTYLRVTSPGAVEGNGPPGVFTAGRMTITTDPESGKAVMLFTDGVHLVYDPKS